MLLLLFFFHSSASTFRQVTDFANVFKAFIGTNWLGIPFAFKQSGILVRKSNFIVVIVTTSHALA